jgi:hypothetical protein
MDDGRSRQKNFSLSPGITAGLLALTVLVAGCTDMYDGQKIKPLEESRFFKDGTSARSLVEGTIPRGHLREDEHLYLGLVEGRFVDAFPFPITDSVLTRGKNQYETFCSPCHGRLGDGEGMIVHRGFPKPNSFHQDSVRDKPAGHVFDVITNGFGRMYSYSPSIRVQDRWAIVAYVRVLQFSRRVPDAMLSEAERVALP